MVYHGSEEALLNRENFWFDTGLLMHQQKYLDVLRDCSLNKTLFEALIT